MALLPILKTNPSEIYALDIRQIVALCGNGRLLDGGDCSQELRAYLRSAPSEQLYRYVETCLGESFEKSGQVLQDIVNELGRRLDFEVDNGLYTGRQNAIGFDGIWSAPTGRALVVEVKTTDTYRFNLDTLASYGERLIKANQIGQASSILIVVGRQDTGDLEAQVRGSRHAWDIRLISALSLIELVKIKERTEEDTVARIRELLIPFEYTRVDRIIGLAFTAVTEVEQNLEKEEAAFEPELSQASDLPQSERPQQRTPKDVIEQIRQKIVMMLSKREGLSLIKKSPALYWSPERNTELRLACTISKNYGSDDYWYLYDQAWDNFLSEAMKGYYVLGGADLGAAFVILRIFDGTHLSASR
jgi:hypothetical protein